MNTDAGMVSCLGWRGLLSTVGLKLHNLMPKVHCSPRQWVPLGRRDPVFGNEVRGECLCEAQTSKPSTLTTLNLVTTPVGGKSVKTINKATSPSASQFTLPFYHTHRHQGDMSNCMRCCLVCVSISSLRKRNMKLTSRQHQNQTDQKLTFVSSLYKTSQNKFQTNSTSQCSPCVLQVSIHHKRLYK